MTELRSATLVIAFLLAASRASAADGLPPLESFVRDFDTIAFGSEFDDREYARVRKWAEPIVIGIEGEASAAFEKLVTEVVVDLAAITGHPITLYAGASPSARLL
ncbi:MAG: DUF2927 domain-containing protein [Alphaproteobacteria bacterium]|nr:DUF2927 domain-containing protein [Alphaproteobacteria bacterium]